VIHPWEDKLSKIPTMCNSHDGQGLLLTTHQIMHVEPGTEPNTTIQKVYSSDLLEHVLGLKIGQQNREEVEAS
jgi:hypothetical protein